MRTGEIITGSDIQLQVLRENGRPMLLFSIPRRRRMDIMQRGRLRLILDESDICAPSQETAIVDRKSSSCSRLYDILRMPLNGDISERLAEREGRDLVEKSAAWVRLEQQLIEAALEQTRSVRHHKFKRPARTHRVHAAVRAA